MKLTKLLQGMDVHRVDGDTEMEIEGVAYDSRQVRPGYIFVALKGNDDDGHRYLHDAVLKGAVALVAEAFHDVREDVTKILVPESREALSKLAARFYRRPFEDVNLVGITGTNGKTTTSYLLESILNVAGANPGVVGTINYRYSGHTYPAPVTTPESVDLMRLMREMADGDVTDVIMEVSSHALDQKRTGGCSFSRAVFTNLSRDHLDYHETMENYFQAKSLLFRRLGKDSLSGESCVAIINMDDPWGKELADLTGVQVISYGLKKDCHVRAESLVANLSGLKAVLLTPEGEAELRSPLIGGFNIYNILAASATALSLDVGLHHVVAGVEKLQAVPGRLEPVKNSMDLWIVVDYAHTPDALLNVLRALRPLARGKLITVFGCGGDRDKGKRYDMGLIAGKYSDLALITSDNPRTERPQDIIEQIEKGTRESGLPSLDREALHSGDTVGYLVEVNRRKAIRKAVSLAGRNDILLIAGKGHEDYQIIGTERRPFDDREEAARAVDERMSHAK